MGFTKRGREGLLWEGKFYAIGPSSLGKRDGGKVIQGKGGGKVVGGGERGESKVNYCCTTAMRRVSYVRSDRKKGS